MKKAQWHQTFETPTPRKNFSRLNAITCPHCANHICEYMVRPAGFEPTAPRLGILCSILLSYGRPRFP